MRGQAGKAETLSLVQWEWHLPSPVQGRGSPVKPSGFGGHWAVTLQLYSSLIPCSSEDTGKQNPMLTCAQLLVGVWSSY